MKRLLEGLVLFLVLRLLSHSLLQTENAGLHRRRLCRGLWPVPHFGRIRPRAGRHLGFLAGGWLTMGMVLSLPMVAAGIWAMLRAK